MSKLLVSLAICLLPTFINGEDEKTRTSSGLSPDKRWEYVFSPDISAGIVKAGTHEVVLDLVDDVPRPQDATVIWAPDSKRFAFTYSPPHAPHTSFETTTVYQLRGEKWEAADPLIEERSDVPQVTQLAKDHPAKGRSRQRTWKSSATRDILRARAWRDANTLVIYGSASWDRGAANGSAAFLFTFQFDADGKWKIAKTEDVKDGG